MRLLSTALASAVALVAGTALAPADPLDGAHSPTVLNFQTLSAVPAAPLSTRESAALRGADSIFNYGLLDLGKQKTIGDFNVFFDLRFLGICQESVCSFPSDPANAITPAKGFAVILPF